MNFFMIRGFQDTCTRDLEKTTVLRIFILSNSITLSLVAYVGIQNGYLSLYHKLANFPPRIPIKTHAFLAALIPHT